MEPFRPFKDKPLYSMTYFQVPAEVLEDAEQLVEWSRKACAVTLGSRGDRGMKQGRSRKSPANKKTAKRRARRSRK
jgi:TfoX/Sxy family transcriptional regulator of competence genes